MYGKRSVIASYFFLSFSYFPKCALTQSNISFLWECEIGDKGNIFSFVNHNFNEQFKFKSGSLTESCRKFYREFGGEFLVLLIYWEVCLWLAIGYDEVGKWEWS